MPFMTEHSKIRNSSLGAEVPVDHSHRSRFLGLYVGWSASDGNSQQPCAWCVIPLHWAGLTPLWEGLLQWRAGQGVRAFNSHTAQWPEATACLPCPGLKPHKQRPTDTCLGILDPLTWILDPSQLLQFQETLLGLM